MKDHELRYVMANELHARPFPRLVAPCRAIHLAIKREKDAATRDRDVDRAHLIELLDRFGAQHPSPGATHFFGQIGKHGLKWECHTEFVSYTLFSDGVAERPFDGDAFELFPSDWLERAPGVRVTSMLIRVEQVEDWSGVVEKVTDWFVPESVAVSSVLEDCAVIAGDFRIDSHGHMRMAVFAKSGTGATRVGRIVQRLTEIETYKSMSMLGLAISRELSGQLNEVETALSHLVADMRSSVKRPEDTLTSLLEIAAELEDLSTRSNFRFAATSAYEALISQRIEALREVRFQSRQTFGEFMMRRFDPAMRTTKAAERRLATMTDRAIRAGDLLRTRVDVERSAQNQLLLESMDRRAALQLRLQKTVEGFSVVAISYYAVNLALYLGAPVAEEAGVSRTTLGLIVTPVVLLFVYFMVKRSRDSVE